MPHLEFSKLSACTIKVAINVHFLGMCDLHNKACSHLCSGDSEVIRIKIIKYM